MCKLKLIIEETCIIILLIVRIILFQILGTVVTYAVLVFQFPTSDAAVPAVAADMETVTTDIPALYSL